MAQNAKTTSGRKSSHSKGLYRNPQGRHARAKPRGGAPKGNRNAWKTGLYSGDIKALRRRIRAFRARVRAAVERVEKELSGASFETRAPASRPPAPQDEEVWMASAAMSAAGPNISSS